MKISELQPKDVFAYFEQILQIPRPSKKEEKIREFLLNFAKEHNFEYKVDKIGNVVIKKPATKGREKAKKVILQSHMDMVPEKSTDSKHNFETDPIKAFVDSDGWIKTKGTTLGGDDGIGVAAQMAVLTATNIKHPAIEALFTVDEETGLTGAFGIAPDLISGDILINLDSEDEGELFIGSAGGMDTTAEFTYISEPTEKGKIAIKILVDNLHGGHSGDEIDKGYANAIKLLNRILFDAYQKFDFRLSEIEGGSLRNAIPKDAKATIVLDKNDLTAFEEIFKKDKADFINEFGLVDTEMTFEYKNVDVPAHVIDRQTQQSLIWALYSAPHGVFAMDKEIEGLVQTSTNLATVRMKENNILKVGSSQRSSIDSAKFEMANIFRTVFEMAGAKITFGQPYPGWKPNKKSEIVNITFESYKHLFNYEPKVRAIHAGLECGLFLEKYPHLDIISFGPTVKGAHTPFEKLDIETVNKFWKLLVDVLEKIPY